MGGSGGFAGGLLGLPAGGGLRGPSPPPLPPSLLTPAASALASRFQRYSPVRTLSRREVTLAFLGPNTWMPVRRQTTLTALKVSLGSGGEWRQARDLRRRMQQQQMELLQPSPR